MSEQATFTPGPWQAARTNWRGEPSDHKVYVRGDVIEPEDGVCEGTATAVCIVEGNATSLRVTEANARLIASAPDLLAACKAILAHECQELPCPVCAEYAKAAIRKAKGEGQ